MIGLEAVSLPNATANLDLFLVISSDPITPLSVTISNEWFGTSIPTKDFPGIGASILTVPVLVAKAMAISCCRLAILVILVPAANSSAYWVTAGPPLTSATLAAIPNDSKVLSIVAALFLTSPRSAGALLSDKSPSAGYFQTVV